MILIKAYLAQKSPDGLRWWNMILIKAYLAQKSPDGLRWWNMILIKAYLAQKSPDDRGRCRTGGKKMEREKARFEILKKAENRFKAKHISTVKEAISGLKDQTMPMEKLFSILGDYEDELDSMTRELTIRYEEQVFLYDMAKLINTAMNIDEMARILLPRIIELLDAHSGSLMLLEGDKLRLAAYFGYEPTHNTFSLDEGIAGFVARKKVLEIVNDPGQDPRFIGKVQGISSIICAPLTCGERLVGILNLNHKKRYFTAGDGKLAGTAAEFAGMLIDNARLSKEKQEQQEIRNRLSRYLSPFVVDTVSSEEVFSLGGEYKDITVLFSDIRGFTSMSERCRPEDIVAQLNQYFTAMVDLVFENGGTLDKFVGDMIMALYGAPVVLPEKELSAIKTAIEMNRALKKLNEKWANEGKEIFHIGIGIHSGIAVVGNIGSSKHMDYTAIGDTVNMAQRLEASAHGGEILISKQVWEKQGKNFNIESAGFLSVKGKSRPIEAYRVLW